MNNNNNRNIHNDNHRKFLIIIQLRAAVHSISTTTIGFMTRRVFGIWCGLVYRLLVNVITYLYKRQRRGPAAMNKFPKIDDNIKQTSRLLIAWMSTTKAAKRSRRPRDSAGLGSWRSRRRDGACICSCRMASLLSSGTGFAFVLVFVLFCFSWTKVRV